MWVFVSRLNINQLVVEGLIINTEFESKAPKMLPCIDIAECNDVVVLSFEELN